MKSKIPLYAALILLTSCTPLTTPLPNAITASLSPTPTATVSENPLQVPTPLNTAHIAPSPVALINDDLSTPDLSLYYERVRDFENSLQFDIRVLDVEIYAWNNDTELYIVKVEATLTNVSTKSIVVRKNLRTGFTAAPEVHWGISYDGISLENTNCCIDGELPKLTPDDFVLLQSGEYQKYTWAFTLPLESLNSNKEKIILSRKPIEITAYYGNFDVGFRMVDDGGNLIIDTDENGDTIATTVDMNAWVGELVSNSVTYVFP